MYVCLCVCVSVENRLEREIAYNADFFQSQVPRTKRYPVYSLYTRWKTIQETHQMDLRHWNGWRNQ